MKRVLAVGIILMSGYLFAQEQGTGKKVMTFEETVKIALRNSVLLNTQKNNLEYNQMLRTSNYAGLGPTLGFSASAQQVDGNTFNQQQGKVINGVFDQVSGQLNANWNLFSGFNQVQRLKQSVNLLEAQAFYINRTAQDVINSVAAAYLQVLLDVELLRIAKENANALNKQLEQITEQVNLGAKSPVDQYNQDSQVKGAEMKALQAEINLINDRALLTQILLIDPSEEFDVVKPTWDVNSAYSNPNSFQELFDTALRSRGDYLRAVKNEQAAKFGMKAYKALMMPNLSAYGVIYSAYNRTHGDTGVRPFDDQIKNDNLRKIYGLQLNIPIFGGNQNLQNRTNYVQQKVLFENATQTRKGLETQVKTDVLRASQTYELYSKTFMASQDQLKAADLAYQLETERYSLGVTNFVDYSNANKVYIQAQTDKAQAEYRLLFQKVLVDYAVGTLKPEDFQQ
jgi:outer membrane protein